MSQEKLYAVKNDEGKYWDFSANSGFWPSKIAYHTTAIKERAEQVVDEHGGHVVALVEEPEKVVVSPEEAELLKNCLWSNLRDAFLNNIILLFRSRRPEDITRLKSALINGYTVAKEKKYNVKVPHTDDSYFYKIDHETCNAADSFHIDLDRPEAKFTKLEIDHYHLQDYKKEEVTDDGMGC